MNQEGDWMCAACQHINFKKRDACQRCNCPKYATEADAALYGRNKSEVLPGDWYCNACCAHNYASRTNCYRCGASKSGYYGLGGGMITPGSYGYDASVPPGYKKGDWICNRLVGDRHGCGWHNYASRTECYKCRNPRDFSEPSSM